MRERAILLVAGSGAAGLFVSLVAGPALGLLLWLPPVVAGVALAVVGAVRPTVPADGRRVAALGGVALAAPPALSGLGLLARPWFVPGPAAFAFGALGTVTPLVDGLLARGWPDHPPVDRALRAGVAGAGAALVLLALGAATRTLAVPVPPGASTGVRVTVALLFLPFLLFGAVAYALGVRYELSGAASLRRLVAVTAVAVVTLLVPVVVTPAGPARVGIAALLGSRAVATAAIAPVIAAFGWLSAATD